MGRARRRCALWGRYRFPQRHLWPCSSWTKSRPCASSRPLPHPVIARQCAHWRGNPHPPNGTLKQDAGEGLPRGRPSPASCFRVPFGGCGLPRQCAHWRAMTGWGRGREEAQGLLFVQLEHGHKCLCGNLYRPQRAHLLLARPTKGRPFAGTPFYLTCSGGVNPPCAKVLASGQNACTAHSAAPRCGAPEGNKKMLPVYSSSSLSTAINASVGICTVPRLRIFFLPSFCFSSSFFLRVMSPP